MLETLKNTEWATYGEHFTNGLFTHPLAADEHHKLVDKNKIRYQLSHKIVVKLANDIVAIEFEHRKLNGRSTTLNNAKSIKSVAGKTTTLGTDSNNQMRIRN